MLNLGHIVGFDVGPTRVTPILNEGCQLGRKEKLSAEKIAEQLAEIALRHLKAFSEEEQERRIAAAERRVAGIKKFTR
jgi:hypothetical protein